MRNQKVRITLYVPQFQHIFIDKNLSKYVERYIANDQDYYYGDISNHLWQVKEEQLICQDCPEDEIPNTDKEETKGIHINVEDKGGESFEMKIDETGIRVQSN